MKKTELFWKTKYEQAFCKNIEVTRMLSEYSVRVNNLKSALSGLLKSNNGAWRKASKNAVIQAKAVLIETK